MSQAETVSAVDLDEIFNTLDTETVKDFKKVITGLSRLLRGREGPPEATQNKGSRTSTRSFRPRAGSSAS